MAGNPGGARPHRGRGRPVHRGRVGDPRRGRDQVLRFRTNVDDWVEADAEHPIRVAHHPTTGEPRPYVLVRGRLEARILRPVFYDLVAQGAPRTIGAASRYGVCSKGTFFPLDEPGADR